MFSNYLLILSFNKIIKLKKMKKLILNKKGTIKSLDIKFSNNLKTRIANNIELNNTFTNGMSSLYDDIIRKRKIKKE